MVGAAWALVQTKRTRADLAWGTGLLLAGPLAVTALRYAEPVCCLNATRPPEALSVALPLAVSAGVIAALTRLTGRALPLWAGRLALKWGPSVIALAQAARTLSGQSPDLAAASEWPWLGVSDFVFRLIHPLRDRMSGRLPDASLSKFVAYTLFFPTLTAGPSDRATDLRWQVSATASRSLGRSVARATGRSVAPSPPGPSAPQLLK